MHISKASRSLEVSLLEGEVLLPARGQFVIALRHSEKSLKLRVTQPQFALCDLYTCWQAGHVPQYLDGIALLRRSEVNGRH